MAKPMSAEEDYTEYYDEKYNDERDYWWNLMSLPPEEHHKLWEQNTTMHPSPNIPEVIFKNKEGSDWD